MDFQQFARLHGVLIDDLQADGRVHRVPTIEKPRRRNGAYRFNGRFGWVQAWDTMVEPAIYRPERPDGPSPAPRAPRHYVPAQDEREAREAAARRAAEIVARCRLDTHPYLARKGFPGLRALVDGDGRLVVPMRPVTRYHAVVSVQWIDERGDKLFLRAGAAKGSVFRIGSGDDTWLCEGFATGLSVARGLRELSWPATVVVTFSAGNLVHVAKLLRGRRYVMADADESGVGQAAAQSTGLPWVTPPDAGHDANDMHISRGIRALAELLRAAR